MSIVSRLKKMKTDISLGYSDECEEFDYDSIVDIALTLNHLKARRVLKRGFNKIFVPKLEAS